MNRLPLELDPRAIDEAVAARRWYAKRSEYAERTFLAELEFAVDRIVEAPERYAVYVHGTRRYLLRRFPFMIVYRMEPSRILVVAVVHGKRKPGYWRNRL